MSHCSRDGNGLSSPWTEPFVTWVGVISIKWAEAPKCFQRKQFNSPGRDHAGCKTDKSSPPLAPHFGILVAGPFGSFCNSSNKAGDQTQQGLRRVISMENLDSATNQFSELHPCVWKCKRSLMLVWQIIDCDLPAIGAHPGTRFSEIMQKVV